MSTQGTHLPRLIHGGVLTLLLTSILACGVHKERREALAQSQELSMTSGGVERTYRLLVPEVLPAQPALLVTLHGRGGHGTKLMKHTRLGEMANAHGFIAVFPDGLDERWDDGRKIEGRHARDVRFLLELIDQLAKRHDINPERVYIAGISNGGFMTARMICEHAERFAGAAMIVSGLSPFVSEHCPYHAPLPIMMFKGTADPLVPYGGGPLSGERGEIVSAEEELRFWRTKNQCSKDISQSNQYNTNKNNNVLVEHSTYMQGCEAHSVQLYKAVNGGHTWPGNTLQYAPKRLIGQPYDDVDATHEIIDFFGLR